MVGNELTRRLSKALIVICLFFLVGTFGFHWLLDISYIDAFYLTVITLSTVGYGDISPHSSMPPDGNPYVIKIFSALIILVGMGALLYAVGIVTEYLMLGEFGKMRRRKRMQKRIAELRGHYILCGAGETGLYIIGELEKTERKFVVIEKSEERTSELLVKFPDLLSIHGDATDDKNLALAGLSYAAGIVLVLRDEKDNLFITVAVSQKRKDCREGLKIVTKVTSMEKTGPKLRCAGADIVISPAFISGKRMVSEMFRPAATTFLDRMLRDGRAVMRIEEVTVAQRSSLANHTLKEARIPFKVGLIIVAVKKPSEEEFTCNPGADTLLQAGDVLIAMGAMPMIVKLRKLAQGDVV
jgi:voltage-gated potassium channel